ncbi:NADH:flavin oxidoreductase [Dietzia cinnamea]|uniref:NADH:flavin oxidoreductase n=1 Tax=Dietzia cinnamea TaxID=321318 RepID=UPI0021A39D1F|nr:NADH:flavin oxidoreductase [Dietzia cinnamea]MCT1640107.1 NADH:flavin oxidoreductase [Dietzia cinnamea]
MTLAPGTPAPDVFSPGKIGNVTLRNRIVKAATFEGRCPRGRITDELIEFHTEYARGGVGMTTVAYLATSPEGRTDKHQYHWGMDDGGMLRKLTDSVHNEGAAISAQVGHAGAVANGASNGMTPLGPSRIPAPTGLAITKACTLADVDRIVEDHVRAARGAYEAGFDALEVHFGHNYLVSEFLSPRLNRRKDEYGGSLENRARFARRIGRAIRDAMGDTIAVTMKLNMDDGVPGGFWIDEARQVARWLEQDGSADALVMTVGSSLLNPIYLFKGDAPLEEFAATQPPVIKMGMKVVGPKMFKEYPYTDAYMFDDARQIREAVDLPMMLLGGIVDRPSIDKAMNAGFEFVAMGRALLREPDFPNKLREDERRRSLCVHCNRCMATIYSGSRCVLREYVPPIPPRGGHDTLQATKLTPQA